MNAVAMYTSVQAASNNDFIVQNAPLVKRIAYHLMSRLPASVQVDDLIQAGMLGLLEAMKHFDSSQGASFETYAGIRIRGAMLDEVRRSDWTPRSVHKKSRMVSEAIHVIENQTGAEARDVDIAQHLGISLGEYHDILNDSVSCQVFSTEDLVESGSHDAEDFTEVTDEPLDDLVQDGFQQALALAIGNLPERERLVISLYYDDELNLREIGEVLNLTESRVSQICTQAILRVRSRLSDWVEH